MIDSTERVEQFTKVVDAIMLCPLATNKEPSKTSVLMSWLSQDIKKLVKEAGKDTEHTVER